VDSSIRVTATYAVAAGQDAAVQRILGVLQRLHTGADAGSLASHAPGNGEPVVLEWQFADQATLDRALRQIGPTLSELTGAAPLGAVHVYGALSEPARAAFASLHAVLHPPAA